MDIAKKKVLLEDCEDAWNENTASGVTSALDNVLYKVGSGSAKISPAASVGAGTILASEAMASTDLSSCESLWFWIRCSVDTEAGDLQILLDNTAKCVSPVETLNVPALTAATWSLCEVALANASSDGAIISVGLKYVTDLGSCDINIDDVNGIIVTPELQRRAIFGWYDTDKKFVPFKVDSTGALDIAATVADIVTARISHWGGGALTSRDVSLDLKALTDVSITGVLKSLGDVAAAESLIARIGAIADAAVAAGATGSASAKLRRLTTDLNTLVTQLGEDIGDKSSPDAGSLNARVGEVQASPTSNTALDRLKELATRTGEVQASPTSNTVLDRLKALLSGIVLNTGTNVIGEVKDNFGGNVYSKTMTMANDNATRFETTAKKLRDVIIVVKTNAMLLGETGVEVYPVGVDEPIGFTKVDISTLYFKNAGAGANGTIAILAVEE